MLKSSQSAFIGIIYQSVAFGILKISRCTRPKTNKLHIYKRTFKVAMNFKRENFSFAIRRATKVCARLKNVYHTAPGAAAADGSRGALEFYFIYESARGSKI